MQDYALLQTLKVDPDGDLLAPFEDFNEFPKSQHWLETARDRLLSAQ